MSSIVGGMYIRDLGILFLGMYRTEIYAYMYGDIYIIIVIIIVRR